MSATAISLSRRAIARRSPDSSRESVLLTFVRLHYGEDIARRVQSRLAEEPG